MSEIRSLCKSYMEKKALTPAEIAILTPILAGPINAAFHPNTFRDSYFEGMGKGMSSMVGQIIGGIAGAASKRNAMLPLGQLLGGIAGYKMPTWLGYYK